MCVPSLPPWEHDSFCSFGPWLRLALVSSGFQLTISQILLFAIFPLDGSNYKNDSCVLYIWLLAHTYMKEKNILWCFVFCIHIQLHSLTLEESNLGEVFFLSSAGLASWSLAAFLLCSFSHFLSGTRLCFSLPHFPAEDLLHTTFWIRGICWECCKADTTNLKVWMAWTTLH